MGVGVATLRILVQMFDAAKGAYATRVPHWRRLQHQSPR